MTFLILKYGKRRPEQDDWRGRGSRCGSKYYRKSSAFFIKPYLTIEPLDNPETENITLSNVDVSGERDPEVFKGKV